MTETKQAMGTLNGVDVDRLVGTIDAIEQAPGLARFQFRAHNQWIDGGHNRSTVHGFFGAGQEDGSRKQAFVLESDEPDVLLGKDVGANPAEYVLHALAGCITTNLVYQAAAQGIRLRSVESRLAGTLDLRGMLGLAEGVRCGYEGVEVSFKIEADAPRERVEELLELANTRSPVGDIIANPVPIRVRLED